jgi:uncharacterized membrane protein
MWIVGFGCGVPLVAVSTIGGAGFGAFFGAERLLVLAVLVSVVVLTIRRSLVSRPGGARGT